MRPSLSRSRFVYPAAKLVRRPAWRVMAPLNARRRHTIETRQVGAVRPTSGANRKRFMVCLLARRGWTSRRRRRRRPSTLFVSLCSVFPCSPDHCTCYYDVICQIPISCYSDLDEGCSLFADPTFTDLLQREHPEILAGIGVRCGKSCFRRTKSLISLKHGKI